MHLFRSDELMSVIVGNVNYDWKVFEQNARYKNGYDTEDKTVTAPIKSRIIRRHRVSASA